MSHLTTDSIASELLEESLLTLEQITTGVTVLAINATRDPEQSPRVRRLLEDLVAVLQEAKEDLGTYAPLDPCARFTSEHSASPSRRVLFCADPQDLIPLGIRLGGGVGGVLSGWWFGRGGVQWIGLLP